MSCVSSKNQIVFQWTVANTVSQLVILLIISDYGVHGPTWDIYIFFLFSKAQGAWRKGGGGALLGARDRG